MNYNSVQDLIPQVDEEDQSPSEEEYGDMDPNQRRLLAERQALQQALGSAPNRAQAKHFGRSMVPRSAARPKPPTPDSGRSRSPLSKDLPPAPADESHAAPSRDPAASDVTE